MELIIEDAKARKNPIILPIILFAIETGMRRSEILAMRWQHIDLRTRVLSIPETKNGHPRKIPLTTKALEILERLDPVNIFNHLKIKRRQSLQTSNSTRGRGRDGACPFPALWRDGALHLLRPRQLPRAFEPFTIFTTDSITGTSISTRTTVASA
ncbi:tyrosine-type recombinase/integrase [Rhodomicrobium vannielii ATCC 17100]|nr:tyrosine-type recombinase/integrase [Rhodomicrobium vannielii ATCC 17100]